LAWLSHAEQYGTSILSADLSVATEMSTATSDHNYDDDNDNNSNNKHEEIIDHITSGCTILAKSEYCNRHEKGCARLH
jgi:hypothetical protein